jgi:Suppressor of fused protein (SUFU)
LPCRSAEREGWLVGPDSQLRTDIRPRTQMPAGFDGDRPIATSAVGRLWWKGKGRPMNLEEVWRIREGDIYPSLFGPEVRGIFPLQMDLFTRQFGQSQVDPRWLHYGVFEFAPTAARRSWLYITSGHSNPWEQSPDEYNEAGESGTGVEFTLATKESGDWGIRTLQSMLAFDILLQAGRYPGREYLGLYDRIPLRAPINGDPACVLRNLVMTEPEGIPGEFQLPSGKVLLTGFTAISDQELSDAKQNGSQSLIDRLRIAGFHPINDPNRPSLV